jgi:preprotein translocase subunit SecD
MIIRKILFVMLLIGLTFACRSSSGMFEKSGTLLTIEVKSGEPNLEETTEKAANILQNRLDALRIDGEVSKISPNRLEAKIYGTNDLEKVKPILLSVSKFELRKAVSPPSPAPIQTFPTEEAAIQSLGGKIPANRKVLSYPDRHESEQNRWIIVENPPIIDGSELRETSAYSLGGSDRDYKIAFSLKPGGAQKFGEWTAANINNYLAIVLNDEVKSAAFIRSQISDSGEISGRFTKQQAEDLALIMRSGYLPANLVLVEEKTFGK